MINQYFSPIPLYSIGAGWSSFNALMSDSKMSQDLIRITRIKNSNKNLVCLLLWTNDIPRRWPRDVSPIKPWSRRPLAGGGVSLDWKQTWLPQSLWQTSQVMFAFLVSFRPSMLLEETAKNSPLAAQTMLTMVSLDNRKGRRKANCLKYPRQMKS